MLCPCLPICSSSSGLATVADKVGGRRRRSRTNTYHWKRKLFIQDMFGCTSKEDIKQPTGVVEEKMKLMKQNHKTQRSTNTYIIQISSDWFLTHRYELIFLGMAEKQVLYTSFFQLVIHGLPCYHQTNTSTIEARARPKERQ